MNPDVHILCSLLMFIHNVHNILHRLYSLIIKYCILYDIMNMFMNMNITSYNRAFWKLIHSYMCNTLIHDILGLFSSSSPSCAMFFLKGTISYIYESCTSITNVIFLFLKVIQGSREV